MPSNRPPIARSIRTPVRMILLAQFLLIACAASDDLRRPAPEEASVSPNSATPQHEHTNRLADEKSPYLLQHAHNPVDWYPWGEEALQRARREDRPIFLSVGYSTCHWCHVMERESFENEAIARLMNAHFVCIKVDREERPDLDEIYMAAVQAMTGQGGWPLNVFLTPGLEPFYGGTYFPPDDRFGRPGFPRVLQSIAEAWETRRGEIESQAETLTRALSRLGERSPSAETLDLAPVDAAIEQLGRIYDAREGGWGSAPKFPRADFGELCLRAYHRGGDERVLRMATDTLDAMARRGMYDHLGGGFARYSTDDRWLVPHFEKMLYDNAQLAFHYLEAFQLTADPRFAEVARGVFDYVLRDLTDPDGGFYSAEDADSEGVEGKFYVWSLDEIREVLADDEIELFAERFGVSESGNWEGHNVLEITASVDTLAERHDLSEDEVGRRLGSARERLFLRREKRVRPGLDDKVLTAWNGLMIRALARGAVVLGEERYADAAVAAADFVRDRMQDERGLLRRWRAGEAAIPAYAEDYAMLVGGLIELYQARFRVEDLRWAVELHARMLELFADDNDGALYNTRAGQEDLLIRTRTGYDGSVPTANSVAAANALLLFELSGSDEYANQAESILKAFGATLRENPLSLARMLVALDAWHAERVELVLVGGDEEASAAWVRAARGGYTPDLAVVRRPVGEVGEALGELLPSLEGKEARDDGLTAYVCRGFACRQPRTDRAAMVEDLGLGQRR